MGFLWATTQAIWLAKFFSEIGLPTATPIHTCADNKGSIANTVDGRNHRRTKHIDVKYHFTKEQVELGTVTFDYIPSNKNLVMPFELLSPALASFLEEGIRQSRGSVAMD